MTGMTKKYACKLALWFGILNGIYCGLYAISPLGKYGLVWVSYVIFPIYILAGAKRKDCVRFSCCAVLGVVWGLIFLGCIAWFSNRGISAALASGLGVAMINTVMLAIHLGFTQKTILNVVPAMFGGVAVTFATGGEHWPVLMITLVLGVLIALASNEGNGFLTEDGRWKWPGKAK